LGWSSHRYIYMMLRRSSPYTSISDGITVATAKAYCDGLIVSNINMWTRLIQHHVDIVMAWPSKRPTQYDIGVKK